MYLRFSLPLITLLTGLACVTQPIGLPGTGDNDSGVNADDAGSHDGGFPGEGLPCDVATFFETNCDSCHSSPPTGGAPVSLLTYSDLAASSILNPALDEAEESLVRVESTTSPMPPGGGLSASDIAVLQDWIDAGTPMGSCTAMTPDSGLPDTPPTCTSNSYWNQGNEGSSRMNPGEACIACHDTSSSDDAPHFTVAGTVYPTVHEPDLCNGASSSSYGAKVTVTDANGKVVTLSTNSAGNFYTSTSLTFPIHASVRDDAGIRVMQTPQTSGDCNSCHTQDGTSNAPGRIVVP